MAFKSTSKLFVTVLWGNKHGNSNRHRRPLASGAALPGSEPKNSTHPDLGQTNITIVTFVAHIKIGGCNYSSAWPREQVVEQICHQCIMLPRQARFSRFAGPLMVPMDLPVAIIVAKRSAGWTGNHSQQVWWGNAIIINLHHLITMTTWNVLHIFPFFFFYCCSHVRQWCCDLFLVMLWSLLFSCVPSAVVYQMAFKSTSKQGFYDIVQL